ncbi:hypothetical protein HO675_10560, partial [Streptococcus suis]|nr:hypothetical protein [Streptococcus suis]
SALNVTDNANATTQVFPQSPTDQRYITHIMDVTVTGAVDKAAGQTPTEAEILAKVTVDTGNSGNIVADPTSMYEKILVPGQQVPTTPGIHTVMVRVITESNVYKDVPVTVVIPATVVEGQPITPIPISVASDNPNATVEVSGLPDGLTFDKTTGEITGTPTEIS